MTISTEQCQAMYDATRGCHEAFLMSTGRVLPDLTLPRNNITETPMPQPTYTAAELFERLRAQPNRHLVLGPWEPDTTGEFGCGWTPGRLRRPPGGRPVAFSGLQDGEPSWTVQAYDGHNDTLGTEADCDAWLREQGYILVDDAPPEEKPSVADILSEVLDELARARSIHGVQHNLPSFDDAVAWGSLGGTIEEGAREALSLAPSWAAILTEEVGEALQAEGENLRAELVQVAAMAVGWIDAIDASQAPCGKDSSDV